MTNFEKIKHITKQLQFYIDEGLLNEGNCSSVLEEIFSAMEILVDSNPEMKEDFSQELAALATVVFP
jgi:hypothetical protein